MVCSQARRFQDEKTWKDKTSESKPQEYGGKVIVKPFASEIATIITNIREEEYQE